MPRVVPSVSPFSSITRYFTLNSPDDPDHATQARMIRRYIAWRNRHAADQRLREIVKRTNVA